MYDVGALFFTIIIFNFNLSISKYEKLEKFEIRYFITFLLIIKFGKLNIIFKG